ncbi:MAG TPA: hypothetical protein VJZ17_05270 [Nitrosopumilaceae archaeon]|nr:hypothetical protein [Nitrosopumilaceae archaeon]
MAFEKREIILIAGILFLMLGMMAIPNNPPIVAVILAIAIYFGVRVFVGRRKRQIQKSIGAGVCAVCGEKIVDSKCPNCDKTK